MSFLDGNPELREGLDNGDVAACLGMPLVLHRGDDRLKAVLFGKRPDTIGDVAYAGLTFGDFLLDYIRIDPVVVEAVDFASAAGVDSVLSFGHWARSVMDADPASLHGDVSRISGYVSERLVARHMQVLGHEVAFPAVANQKGWDLLVDGRKFQIKNYESASGIRRHLEESEFPFIVNRELADAFSADDRVYVDHDLSNTEVRTMTKDSLERGSDLLDFEIPWFALAAASVSEAVRIARGETDLTASLVRVPTNMAGRAFGAWAGSSAASAGMLLLFGPAGAVVGGLVGSIGGSIAGGSITGAARTALLTSAEANAVRDSIATVSETAVASAPAAMGAIEDKSAQLEGVLSGGGARAAVRDFADKRMEERHSYLVARVTEIERLGGRPSGPIQDSTAHLLRLLARAHIHPDVVREPMGQLGERLKAYVAAVRRHS